MCPVSACFHICFHGHPANLHHWLGLNYLREGNIRNGERVVSVHTSMVLRCFKRLPKWQLLTPELSATGPVGWTQLTIWMPTLRSSSFEQSLHPRWTQVDLERKEGDAETGDDFRLKEQLSPALRKEVQQIKADLAARDAESIVEETDGPCEARAPPRTSADRGKGASGRVTEAAEVEVPAERPLAFEVGHGHFAFAPPPEDRFQGFQEVGTLREALSI
eukprot:s55_g22.t1